MTPLFLALSVKAQDELIRGHAINILNAAFRIEADPDRSDDEGAIVRNISVEDAFSENIPWLNDELSILRKICNGFNEDFDRPANTLLRAALLAKRYEIEEIKERETARPLLSLVTPMVGIWAIAWTLTPGPGSSAASPGNGSGERNSQTGRPDIGYKEYLNDGAMDAVTLAKVRERIRAVNEVMGTVVTRLLEE